MDEAASTPPTPERRKRMFRFKPVHDIALLRAVMRHRPWTAAHGETMHAWTSIAEEFNADMASTDAKNGSGTNAPAAAIDPRAGQRRYKTLVDAHLSGDVASLRSAGAPEDVAQRDQLIADVHRMARDYRSVRNGRRNGKAAAAEAVGGWSDGHDDGDVEADPSVLSMQLAMPVPTLAALSEPYEDTRRGHRKRPLEEEPEEEYQRHPNPNARSPANKRVAVPARGRFEDLAQSSGSMEDLASINNNAEAWDFLRRHLEMSDLQHGQELKLAKERLELERQRFELEKREREKFIQVLDTHVELMQHLVQKLEQ